MDHLSSCYFCGAALDEPLGAYTIEPSDGARSVTLCVSCRHKLDRLLDETGIGETVPAEASSVEAGADDSESEEPRVGEKEPSELLDDETSEEPTQVDEELSAEADEGSDSADESADTQEQDERADATTASEEGPADEWSPDSDELPDDEEIKEVPGIAADADESATGDWETDIQNEMQPNVPDASADSESETDQSPASTTAEDADAAQPEATEVEHESEAMASGGLEDEPTAAEPAADDDPILTDAEGPVEDDPVPELEDDPEPATGDEPEETERAAQSDPNDESNSESVGDDEPLASPDDTDESGDHAEPSDRSEDPPAEEGSIDPSILQADEIASGDADIEEGLDGDIEIPDELEASEAEEVGSREDDSSDQPQV